ncbi:MAG: serine hydrolase domain-containing protein [Chloroflexales bacterium]
MTNGIETPETVGLSSARLAHIRPAMQRYIDQRGFRGISTLLARRGKLVHFEQVGWRDREADLPMAPDTIFRIYSMTKPIICAALMTLYEEGRFHLFDPLAAYIPAFGAVKVLRKTDSGDTVEEKLIRPITVRDLLTHTSGLTYSFLDNSPVSAIYREAGMMSDAGRTLAEIIDGLAKLPLAYQPGTRWHYSVGIDVAARLIEVIGGQPLRAFLQERIFTPLGMVDTDFGVAPAKLSRLAAMYGLPDIAGRTTSFVTLVEAFNKGFNRRIDISDTYPVDTPDTFVRGGHGLFSTAPDYMRFAQMLLNGGTLAGERIIGRKTLDLMHSNHIPANLLPYEIGGVPADGYGFGLGSRVLQDVGASALPGSVGEFGWGGAAKTYYWVDPREELVGIFMTQSMVSFDAPDKMFQLLAYQALD